MQREEFLLEEQKRIIHLETESKLNSRDGTAGIVLMSSLSLEEAHDYTDAFNNSDMCVSLVIGLSNPWLPVRKPSERL